MYRLKGSKEETTPEASSLPSLSEGQKSEVIQITRLLGRLF